MNHLVKPQNLTLSALKSPAKARFTPVGTLPFLSLLTLGSGESINPSLSVFRAGPMAMERRRAPWLLL